MLSWFSFSLSLLYSFSFSLILIQPEILFLVIKAAFYQQQVCKRIRANAKKATDKRATCRYLELYHSFNYNSAPSLFIETSHLPYTHEQTASSRSIGSAPGEALFLFDERFQ